MKKISDKYPVLYIPGQGGSAAESAHYRPLFPDAEVFGLDCQGFTPWEAGAEIRAEVEHLLVGRNKITLLANSIGAYFSMIAGIDRMISTAFFISPIVDMEELLTERMRQANITEAELSERGVIQTGFGDSLSWQYLRYVREHPIHWTAPTKILYGSRDNLTSLETISGFAKANNASLTVMDAVPGSMDIG